MTMYYVYVDVKPDGTPFYVGKGASKRVSKTKRNLAHSNIRAKYPDWDRVVIFSSNDEDAAFNIERKAIAYFGRKQFGGLLVNFTDGGEGATGAKRSPERIAQQSDIMRGHTFNLGFKHSDQTKVKMSAAQKGKQVSDAARLNMSVAARNRALPTEETKAKISASLFGNKRTLGKTPHNKGKSTPLEIRVKISEAAKRRYSNGP